MGGLVKTRSWRCQRTYDCRGPALRVTVGTSVRVVTEPTALDAASSQARIDRCLHTLLRSPCQKQHRKKGSCVPAQPSTNVTDSPDCLFRQPFVANLFLLPAQGFEKLRLKCHQDHCVCRDVSPIHRSMKPVMLCFSVNGSGASRFSSSPSPLPRLIPGLVAAPPS